MKAAANIAAIIILSAYALPASPAWGITLTFTREELQESVQKKFPLEKGGKLLKLVLSDPKVDLKEGSGRIGISAGVAVEALGKAKSGTVRVDGELEYVPEKGEFLLKDPKVLEVDAEGMKQTDKEKVAALATTAFKAYFAEHPVYRLKDGKMKDQLLKHTLKSFSVKDGKLVVEMGLF